MKITQGVFFSGYIKIKVTGKFPEFFFNRCAEKGIQVWDVKKVGEDVCVGNIKLQHLSEVRRIRKETNYKLAFEKGMGLPFLFKRFLTKKPLIIGLMASLLILFLLSNMVWGVKVDGVTPELEHKIEKRLESYGVKVGAWKFKLATPGQIQQKLMQDIPDLLWIGVKEKGTNYVLQGVEKAVVEEQDNPGPQHLIAAKNGVIVDMFVSEGNPQVKINSFVNEGDILVSGLIGPEDNQKPVSAEGSVIAETWYKSAVTVPLNANYKVLTGNSKKTYGLLLGNFEIPMWGIKKPEYKSIHIDKHISPLYFLKWKLPIGIVNKTLSEEETIKETRTEKEAVLKGKSQARKNLSSKLPNEAIIKDEKILHQGQENGKVKLVLYYKVEENIVKTQPIIQGD